MGFDRGGKSKGKDKEDERKGKMNACKGKGKNTGKGKSREVIPIETANIRPDFGIRSRLLGENSENILHIQEQTGAHVDIRGRDGEDYMELIVGGYDDACVKMAVGM